MSSIISRGIDELLDRRNPDALADVAVFLSPEAREVYYGLEEKYGDQAAWEICRGNYDTAVESIGRNMTSSQLRKEVMEEYGDEIGKIDDNVFNTFAGNSTGNAYRFSNIGRK